MVNDISKENLKNNYLVKGLSSYEIASIYGCSNRTILNKLELFGIPKRTYKDNKMPTRKGGHLSVIHRDHIHKALKGNPKVAGIKGEANPRYKSHKVECFVCHNQIIRKNCFFKQFNRFFCSFDCQSKYKKTLVGKMAGHWKGGGIQVNCAQCDSSLIKPKCIVNSSKTHRFFCSKKCSYKWKSDNLNGDKIYNWKGGYDGYYGPNWLKQRRKALERDNKTCKICNKTQKQLGKNPDVHHIIPFIEFTVKRFLEANNLTNLICFCSYCHSKVTNGIIKFTGKNYSEICEEILILRESYG